MLIFEEPQICFLNRWAQSNLNSYLAQFAVKNIKVKSNVLPNKVRMRFICA